VLFNLEKTTIHKLYFIFFSNSC